MRPLKWNRNVTSSYQHSWKYKAKIEWSERYLLFILSASSCINKSTKERNRRPNQTAEKLYDTSTVHSPSNFFPVLCTNQFQFYSTTQTYGRQSLFCSVTLTHNGVNRQWDCRRLQQLNNGKPVQYIFFLSERAF